MSWITKLKEKAQDRAISLLFISIGLLALIVWAAIPSEVWASVSGAIPKSVLWALLGLLLIAVSLGAAYVFNLRKQLDPKDEFAFGVYWNSDLNPLCPACKTPLSQSRRHLMYFVGEGTPLPKPITECLKCDKHVPLYDDNGNEVKLSDAKKRLSESKRAS